MDAPAITIDYERLFSIPFGLAPVTDAGFVNGLSVEAGYAFYRRQSAPFRWPPERLEVAGIPFADGLGAMALVPASTTDVLGVATTRTSLTQAQLNAVGGSPPPPAVDSYRWDATASKTGPFPLPAYDDGAFVVRWRPAPAPAAPGGAVTDGVVENMFADYLLPTHATGGDGEAARDLVRAPLVGMVRFERYRHLVLTGATLSVGAHSASGAVVIRSRAGGSTPPAGLPPAEHSAVVVLENIDRVSAVQDIGRLAWASIVRRGDIASVVALRGDTRRTHRLLVQAYLDYAHVARATHRPGLADPLALVTPAMRSPFEAALPKPSNAAVEVVLTRCFGETTLRAALLDFVTTVFAEIITGATWTAIGVSGVEGPAAPAATLAAQSRLKLLSASPDAFVPCFAGAPLGRAAAIVVPAGQTPSPSLVAQSSLTPFHQEALVAAGRAVPAIDDYGRLAVLRVIDDSGLDVLLTTRDLLDAVVKGSNTSAPWPPPLDLQPLADLGHPYVQAVQWPHAVAAAEARANLDALRAARPKVELANIGFWKGRTGLVTVVAGKDQWPLILPGVGADVAPPTPSAPYLEPPTRPFPDASGFDLHDIEAVLRARSVVRDARSGNTDIPVPLFLALMDRESYRSLGTQSRRAIPVVNPNIGLGPTPTNEQRRIFSLMNWLTFPFGLDLLVRGTPLGVSPTAHPLLNASPAQFQVSFPSLHGRLVSTGLLAADLEPLLNETDCLDYLSLRRPGRSNGGAGVSMVLRSRSAQWMGIALQMATFQFVHQQLTAASLERHSAETNAAYVAVEEFTKMKTPAPGRDAMKPPAPGLDANSQERRSFIAYWSLVYLAFNIQPATWNAWVDSVPDAKLSAGLPAVSQFLLDHQNAGPTIVDTPPAPGPRRIGHRGHQVRFAAGLDAYMRLGVDADEADIISPAARAWPAP